MHRARGINVFLLPALPYLDPAERKSIVSRHESALWLLNTVLVCLSVWAAAAAASWAGDEFPGVWLGIAGASSLAFAGTFLAGHTVRSAVLAAIVRRRV